MITGGVDLAAEAKGTAVATIAWSDSGAHLRDLVLGAEDDVIADAATSVDKLGIDWPLGWPTPFVEFISRHSAGDIEEPVSSGREWRRTLAYRTTDEAVQKLTGLAPLSGLRIASVIPPCVAPHCCTA